MNPYLRIVRPVNCLISLMAVWVLAVVVLGQEIPREWFRVLLGSTAAAFVAAGGNVLNDYFDVEVDRVNHPDRPLVTGEITKGEAEIYALALFSAGMLFGFFTSLHAFIIVMVAEALLFLYEWRLKATGLPGNLTVSGLVGLLFLYGGAIFQRYDEIYVLALMAFLSNAGREIAKDVEDVEGDVDRRTLPRILGTGRASFVAAIFYLAAVALSPLPYLQGIFGLPYLLTVGVADAVFIYSTFLCPRDAGRAQRISKVAMVLGLIAFLAGGLT